MLFYIVALLTSYKFSKLKYCCSNIFISFKALNASVVTLFYRTIEKEQRCLVLF